MRATTTLRRDMDESIKDPVSRGLWCAGDWNFLAPGESQMSISSPSRCTSAADVSAPSRGNQKTWQEVLNLMVELQQTAPTHYSPSKFTCSRIDRIYTTTPGWILTNVQCSACLLAQPRELHEKGISDHALVSTSTSLKRRLPKELQPIPKVIVESEHFKKRHDELVAQSALRELPPVQRWELHKVILRQSGEYAREMLLHAGDNTELEVNQTLTTIARTL